MKSIDAFLGSVNVGLLKWEDEYILQINMNKSLCNSLYSYIKV